VIAKLGRAARLVTRGDSSWFRAPALAILDEDLEHGVTHASHGNFSLSRGEDPRVVEGRRAKFLEDLGLGEARVIAPKLHHSADVAVVLDPSSLNGDAPSGIYDAIVARGEGIVLAVTVADCVPVFFVHPDSGVIGIAHAGWKGVAGGIVLNVIQAIEESFDVPAEELFVATGPAIRGPSYEVGPEVAGLFPEEFAVPSKAANSDRFYLDLPSCALSQARGKGVPRDNLVDFSLCTWSHPGDLHSYRRGDNGRHWAFIGRV
jgi:YfiH family protein